MADWPPPGSAGGGAVRGPAAVLRDVDAAGAQALGAEKRLGALSVSELDGRAIPAWRLELGEAREVRLVELVQLGRDRDAGLVLDQRRPAAIDLEEPVAR